MIATKTMLDNASDFTNEGHNITREQFLQQMQRMHPTEQQIFAGLVLAWMQDYVNYSADHRNKYSIAYFTELLACYKGKHPDEPLRKGFPLI